MIADVTALALYRLKSSPAAAPSLSGTYHLAAGGWTSWHGYANFVLELAHSRGTELKVRPGQIQAIPASEYPTPAARPGNSRMDTGRLRDTFGVELPDWRRHVERMIEEILV